MAATETFFLHYGLPTWLAWFDVSFEIVVIFCLILGLYVANEKAVRERVYELWDHAGRPNGRSDEFWFAAKAELERKEGTRERGSCALVRRRRERLLIGGSGSVPRGFEMLAARRARMKDDLGADGFRQSKRRLNTFRRCHLILLRRRAHLRLRHAWRKGLVLCLSTDR